jgi:hypothetical protein
MITEKWRAGFRKTGRVLIYLAAVAYLLAMYDKISSIQSDVSSMQSDVSEIEDGSCPNDHLCR